MFTTKGILIVAPSLKHSKDLKALHIMHSEVVKFVAHFSMPTRVIFLRVKPSCGRYIRDQLQMPSSGDKGDRQHPIVRDVTNPLATGSFFSPLGEARCNKIVLFPKGVSEETRNVIKLIYNHQVLDEINQRSALAMVEEYGGMGLNNNFAEESTPETVSESDKST